MALAETARLAVQIDLGGNASAGLRGLERQVKGLGGSVGRIGKGFGQIGVGIARAGLVAGGAVITGLTGAAKAAIDFEDAFAGVRKTVDEADLKAAGLSFESLSDAFRKMATEIPITASEFARIGETAGALGVKARDIETFTKTVSMLGVTTDLTSDMAADALGRIGTILRFTGKDYENFADSLVNLGNAGASTESEIVQIVQRFAAEGKAAGLATDQIAALASATASLGFAPERGGTALSRVFANMATHISLADAKGKAFAKGTGRSIADLQSALNKGEGLGIFMDVLKELKGLSATDANKFLASIGVTNTSDRTIFRTMADNLPFVNEQLEIARKSQGALLEEANKKFATTASKLQIFKNNIIEAGITVGEQFLPAVQRALDKLIALLKAPGTKADLMKLGKDVGAAIDSIDWDKVVEGAKSFGSVLKGALDITLTILKAIDKLPTELKAAAAALLVLNKASGGLVGAGVGNVVGGLAETVTRSLGSKLPGVGKLFVQPVYVTNMPMGGMGGGLGGAAAGIGAGTLLAGAALTAAAAAGVAIVQQEESRKNTEFSADIKAGLDSSIFGKSQDELRTALAGVDQGIADLSSNPLYALVQGEALDNLRAMKASLEAQLADPKNSAGGKSHQDLDPNTRQWRNDNPDKVAANIKENAQRLKDVVAEQHKNREQADTIGGKTQAGLEETSRASLRGASLTTAATRSGSASVVSAIYANRPITNVSVNVSSTSVTKNVTTTTRYGGTGSSRSTDKNASQHV